MILDLSFGALVAAYVALAVLLLSLHLYSSWSWWIKAIVTGLLAGFYFVTYSSIPPLLGWPTPYDLPDRLYLVGVDIAEPDYIYLWARDLDRGLDTAPPRAYRVAYTKARHLEADMASRKLRKGLAVIGEIESNSAARPSAAEGETVPIDQIRIRFVDAPEGLIPRKD